MASFYFSIYFPFRYQTVLVNPELKYSSLIDSVFDGFHIDPNDGNLFLLQIFDPRYKSHVEFDDEYINRLRKRLSRTRIESLHGRIVCRQQPCLLPWQLYFSMDVKPTHSRLSTGLAVFKISPPPYVIVWLDEYVALPKNFRSMKKYLFTATQLEGPICDTCWLESDIDNLIVDNREVTFDLCNFNGHLKMFTNVDQCRNYIASQQNNLILLIASNEHGQIILPSVYDRILSTYILRSDWHDFEWGFKYLESLQMFDDDLYMISRVVRDLARYFMDRASQVEPVDAIQYLTWAKKLYLEVTRKPFFRYARYSAMILNYIDHQLNHLEAIVKTLDQDFQND